MPYLPDVHPSQLLPSAEQMINDSTRYRSQCQYMADGLLRPAGPAASNPYSNINRIGAAESDFRPPLNSEHKSDNTAFGIPPRLGGQQSFPTTSSNRLNPPHGAIGSEMNLGPPRPHSHERPHWHGDYKSVTENRHQVHQQAPLHDATMSSGLPSYYQPIDTRTGVPSIPHDYFPRAISYHSHSLAPMMHPASVAPYATAFATPPSPKVEHTYQLAAAKTLRSADQDASFLCKSTINRAFARWYCKQVVWVMTTPGAFRPGADGSSEETWGSAGRARDEYSRVGRDVPDYPDPCGRMGQTVPRDPPVRTTRIRQPQFEVRDPWNILACCPEGQPNRDFVHFIHNMIQRMTLSPTSLIAAAWFVRGLGLHDGDGSCGSRLRQFFRDGFQSKAWDDATGVAERVALLGLVLAGKSLDDNAFLTKSWCEVTEVPIKQITYMERHSLQDMYHALYIPVDSWADHLCGVHWNLDITSQSDRDDQIVFSIVHNMLEDTLAVIQDWLKPPANFERRVSLEELPAAGDHAVSRKWGEYVQSYVTPTRGHSGIPATVRDFELEEEMEARVLRNVNDLLRDDTMFQTSSLISHFPRFSLSNEVPTQADLSIIHEVGGDEEYAAYLRRTLPVTPVETEMGDVEVLPDDHQNDDEWDDNWEDLLIPEHHRPPRNERRTSDEDQAAPLAANVSNVTVQPVQLSTPPRQRRSPSYSPFRDPVIAAYRATADSEEIVRPAGWDMPAHGPSTPRNGSKPAEGTPYWWRLYRDHRIVDPAIANHSYTTPDWSQPSHKTLDGSSGPLRRRVPFEDYDIPSVPSSVLVSDH